MTETINAENTSISYEYLVNVFDAKGIRIEQKWFKTFDDANAFMIMEHEMGYDTHLSRLQLITE